MNEGRPKLSRLTLSLASGLVALLLLVVWVFWLLLGDNDHRHAASAKAEAPPSKTVTPEPRPREPAPSAQPELANDGIPIMAPGSEDSSEHGRRHPHPIGPTRRRIYRENNFNGALMGAMDVGDYEGLRKLIEEYKADYPEDEYRLQEGYSIIADCLEKLTPERQEFARHYWKTKRGSTVRRFIRRYCLEKPVVKE